MRIATGIATLLICAALPVVVVAEPGKTESGTEKLTSNVIWHLRPAAYTREVWIGFESDCAPADSFLKALAGACNDQTSVAVIASPQAPAGVRPDADEAATLATISSRAALSAVLDKLQLRTSKGLRSPAGQRTRIVAVGVAESCVTALRVATNQESLIDSVLLVDPPVGDLPQLSAKAGEPGVDVLLHPRSEAEFTRESGDLVQRLGGLGKSARVLRGPRLYADLDQRLAFAVHSLRGYSLDLPAREGETPLQTWLRARKDSQVVHVGELHGNPGAHRLQLEALRELIAQGGPLALSMEQFERDVQPVLDKYLRGEISEEEFLKNSRPWPNYADYRPLIELCREKKIPVIAGNIPRRLASRVFKEGVEVLEKFSDDEKAWSAKKLVANPGAYHDKFFRQMGADSGHNENLERMYASQCIKDDTMAESIADWLKQNPKGRVLHINGGFHSEGGLGVPEKLGVLAPGVKQTILTCVEAEAERASKPADMETIVQVPGSRPQR